MAFTERVANDVRRGVDAYFKAYDALGEARVALRAAQRHEITRHEELSNASHLLMGISTRQSRSLVVPEHGGGTRAVILEPDRITMADLTR